MPGWSYNEDQFFACDDAPPQVQKLRRAGFDKLAGVLNWRHPRSVALTKEARERISDLQFTAAYRVPFQYSKYVRDRFSLGAFWESAQGTVVRDLDGNDFIDLTGSYGVNVFGHDFYRSCMEEAGRRAAGLGAMLGGYHPAVAWNAEELCRISKMDEVSFHMSGTEAVMQAVRLARYHTKRKNIVRFCGAYHGWWDDVQPGPGNPMPPGKVYTLAEMSNAALRVLRKRRDVACVLVNPLQALHPNSPAPADGSTVDSSRCGHFDRAKYTEWLKKLREVCTANGIILILDEVFLGFRLSPGGAQEYFGVAADMVTYGKTVGGGFPIGVVCGKRQLMKRFREEQPGNICFARGTFNSHPYVMCGMQVFLEKLQTPEIQAIYKDLEDLWNQRATRLNELLSAEGLPVRVANMSTVWTVMFTEPSRFNWMFQFYLRAHGLALSWVGTGRLIFSLNFTDDDFANFCRRFVAAAKEMQADGWWWFDPGTTNKTIRRNLLREMIAHWRGAPK